MHLAYTGGVLWSFCLNGLDALRFGDLGLCWMAVLGRVNGLDALRFGDLSSVCPVGLR